MYQNRIKSFLQCFLTFFSDLKYLFPMQNYVVFFCFFWRGTPCYVGFAKRDFTSLFPKKIEAQGRFKPTQSCLTISTFLELKLTPLPATQAFTISVALC